MLVIADDECALGMAGVMGGANSGVGANTRNLVLECAHFIPEVVAGRARRFGLQSEAAHRFERGVDPELPRRALERATELLVQLVGGTVGPIVEVSDPHSTGHAGYLLSRRCQRQDPAHVSIDQLSTRLRARNNCRTGEIRHYCLSLDFRKQFTRFCRHKCHESSG